MYIFFLIIFMEANVEKMAIEKFVAKYGESPLSLKLSEIAKFQDKYVFGETRDSVKKHILSLRLQYVLEHNYIVALIAAIVIVVMHINNCLVQNATGFIFFIALWAVVTFALMWWKTEIKVKETIEI